jgi:hypothetical protein
MKSLPTKEENPNGFHQRYKVERLEGETDPNACYFVLRLDCQGTDIPHIRACRVAALAYAESVEGTHLNDVGLDLHALVKKAESQEVSIAQKQQALEIAENWDGIDIENYIDAIAVEIGGGWIVDELQQRLVKGYDAERAD